MNTFDLCAPSTATALLNKPSIAITSTDQTPDVSMMDEFAPESSFSSVSRQKSCHACVKGKRGCDKRQPVCSRCKEKNIQCIYAKRTYAEAFYDLESVELDMSWAGFAALSSSIDFVDDIPPSIAPPAIQDPTRRPTLDAFVDPFPAFDGTQAMQSSDMQLFNNAGEPLSKQQEKEQTLSKFDYSPMADLCVRNSLVKRCHR